ncbi:hypothetical protein ACP4OV_014007 [Aristida adscensionis]
MNKNSSSAKKRVNFSVLDIFPSLELFIPGLFAQLQEAVYEMIEIQHPQELQAIRSKTTGAA